MLELRAAASVGLLGSFTFLALFCFPRAGAEERLPYFPGVQLLQHFKALNPGRGGGKEGF